MGAKEIARLTEEANELTAQRFEIQEQMQSGFRVDREKKTIFDVCLLKVGESKNGWKYSGKLLQESTALYDRKPVYLNHVAPGAKRNVRDIAGRIANPRFQDGKLCGDIKAIGSAGEMLMDVAESDVDGIGMSHVTDGTSRVRGKLVESIGGIKSVDLVDGPSATKSLREETLELQEQLKSVLSGKKNALKRLEAIYEACGEDYKLEEQELPAVPVLTLETVADLREIAKDKPAIKTLLEQHDKLQKDRWVAETIIEAKLPNTEATVSALSKLDSKELMLASGKVIREAIDASKPELKQKGRELPTGTSLTVDKLVSAVRS